MMSKTAKTAERADLGTSIRAKPQGGAMKPIKLVTPISDDPDASTQNLVGLGALAAELAAEGVSVRDLFARTGIDAVQLEDARARISHRQGGRRLHRPPRRRPRASITAP